jgi:antitoxin (DNA-binding transcriptional repressor) of toxin-antitoxin stability system
MTKIPFAQAQSDFAACVRRVQSGETLVIVQGGQPIAEIKPLPAAPETRRPIGLCAGAFTVPEDFDAPLPAEVVDQFEGR